MAFIKIGLKSCDIMTALYCSLILISHTVFFDSNINTIYYKEYVCDIIL